MAKKRARHRPEELFNALDRGPAETADVRELLHELHIDNEQLTVQNDHLLKTQTELEHSRDRYADLYDMAPIGYLTIDTNGIVFDINLTGAEMLGKGRALFNGLPIFTAIDERDAPCLRQFLLDCAQQSAGLWPQVVVRTRRQPKSDLRLLVRSVISKPGQGRFFIAMLDVTEERRLGAERRSALEEAEARAEALANEVRERQKAEQRIKLLLERLVTAQEEERRRIALNLHDHLGQQLTALRLTVSALKAHGLSSKRRAERVDAIDTLVAALDKDLDRLAWDLRPIVLDEMGLESALGELVRQWSTTHGVPAELHISNDRGRAPHEIETQLYRIVQEALNNVSKHAGASTVSVVIERRADQILLTIEDDGRGFDPDVTSRSRHAGMGLIGMQERAALLDGDCSIESTTGHGTNVLVRIPLKS